MIENIGLIAGLLLLIVLALKGVNIIFSSLLCSLLVIVSNQLPIAESFSQSYAFGPLGAFTFAGKFFILFICGSVFGRAMAEGGAAISLANALADRLGADKALWIITLCCALLTYGGVILFIVVFTLYPLSLQLLKTANIPKRLFCGALALGGGTFTLTALPGTPSIQNVIASSALGTDLFAAPGLGLIASLIMFGFGIWYLERERLIARERGEGFVAAATDQLPEDNEPSINVPHWMVSVLPLVLVIAIILMPRFFDPSTEWLNALFNFARQEPILWPSFALTVGCVASVVLFSALHKGPLLILGKGSEDAIMPLMNTAAVIGFGGVVVQTTGFTGFVDVMLNSTLPPLMSLFIGSSLTSALVGSSSGGLQIFMETMAPHYLAIGIDREVLHRLAAIISGGFDSLPHCGAIVAILTITGLTHRQAYRDMAVVTVAIPVLAALVLLAIVGLSG